VTKSIVSTLVGALIHERKLDGVDVSVAKSVRRPARTTDAAWERASALTLRHAMNMATGYEYLHNAAESPLYATNIDRLAYALGQKVAARPGERFTYSDGDASITGAVVANAAGEPLYAYAKRTLFDPLQMATHDWWFRDSAGTYPGGWGLRLRPMDMLKVGQLYIQKGEWNGRRVFDANWPATAWTHGVSTEYGLHWWLPKFQRGTAYEIASAIGFKGQRIYVLPQQGIVVAVVSGLTHDEEDQLAGLVPAAVYNAARSAGTPPTLAVRSELAQLVRIGFHGTTRVRQFEQDAPKLR
jgi:CubicO group peptidase (beta-lactamase class C family)